MCIFSGDDDALRKVILYLILLYIARGQLVSRMQASRLLVRAFDRPTDTFFVLFSFAEILAMRSFSRWAAELGSATHHRQGGRQWTCSLSGQNRLIDPLRWPWKVGWGSEIHMRGLGAGVRLDLHSSAPLLVDYWGRWSRRLRTSTGSVLLSTIPTLIEEATTSGSPTVSRSSRAQRSVIRYRLLRHLLCRSRRPPLK